MTLSPSGVSDPRRGWCVWMKWGGWVTEMTEGTAGAEEGPGNALLLGVSDKRAADEAM